MTLHKMFLKSALKHKNIIAIYDQATGKNITYKKLILLSIIFADKIKHYKNQNIGIMIPTSAGAIISTLATLITGKTPVMINYSMSAIKSSVYAQNKCQFNTILTSKKLLDKLSIKPIKDMVFLEDIVANLSIIDKIKGLIKSIFPHTIYNKGNENDNAVILFTSGSEKDPKAVPLSHKNIIHNINGINMVFDFKNNEIFMSILPLFHIFGLTTSFWLPITKGYSLIAQPNPLEYQHVSDNIKNYNATCITATPTFFRGYLKKSHKDDFKSLRIAISGGDKLPKALVDEFFEKHNVMIYEGYGTTETSPVISSNTAHYNKPGSIGKPLPNVKVKIVNVDNNNELSTNKIGKIIVKGDLVMRGYIDEPNITIKDGWYDTGDMGLIDEDGFLWHKGRLKRFVKIGGERVSLMAVEEEAIKVMPDNSLCCAVEIPNKAKGAEIILAITKKVDQKQIIKTIKNAIGSIAIPKKFIYLDELPIMSNGKIDFRLTTKICHEKLYEKAK